MRRRPPLRRLGVVACSFALLATAACSDTVTIDAPHLSGADGRACAALVKALPHRVADQPRRTAQTGAGYGAAWGDPAIELRCGVRTPEGFDRFSECQTVNGVDWYVPGSQQTGEPDDITMTSIGRAEYVEVRIPQDYFPPANTMVDLAPAVKRTIRAVKPCV